MDMEKEFSTTISRMHGCKAQRNSQLLERAKTESLLFTSGMFVDVSKNWSTRTWIRFIFLLLTVPISHHKRTLLKPFQRVLELEK